MPRLVVGKGRSKGRYVDLPKSGELVVGRELTNELPIRDAQASRKHFKLRLEEGVIRVEDLGSVNGTWVNGEKASGSVTIGMGDKIRVGETILYIIGDREDENVGELTGRELAGYKLGRLLGRGAMGHVYEAMQLSLERQVAFKVLAKELAADETFVKNFLEEARAAGRLNHPNIVQVYDVGNVAGTYFYSLELMHKGSVEDLLQQHGRLPLEIVLPIAIDAARGLEYAEKRGLIHRDIKPANLFLSNDGVCKIGDLGIAQRFDGEGSRATQEVVSGSPHYIAPEQALGKDIDHRVDLYALGVSLFEMVAGETPYSGRSPQEIMLKHVKEEVPRLGRRFKDVHPDFDALVYELMAKEPEQRPANAGVLVERLVPLLSQFPPRATAMIRLSADLRNSGRLIPSSDSTTASADPDSSPRLALPWKKILLGILLALLLLSIVNGVKKSREAARAAREQRLNLIKNLQDRGATDPADKVVAEAAELENLMQAEGYPDLARRARKIGEEGLRRRELERQRDFDLKATRELALLIDEAKKLIGKTRELPLIDDLTERTKGWQKSFAESSLVKDADRVINELNNYREVLARMLADERDANVRFEEAKNELVRVLTIKVKAMHFGESFAEIGRFRDRYPEDRYQKAAIILEAQIRGKAVENLRLLGAEVSAVLSKGEYGKARAMVKEREEAFACRDYEQVFNDVRKHITETEAAAERARLKAQRDREDGLLNASTERVVKAIAERKFDDAVRCLNDVLSKLELPDLRERTIRRAALYEASQNALDALVDYVNISKGESGIKRIFPIPPDSESRGIAVEADRTQISFEVQKGVLIPVEFPKLSPSEIVDYARKGKPEGSERLNLACLAWALGEEESAKIELGASKSGLAANDLALLTALEECLGS